MDGDAFSGSQWNGNVKITGAVADGRISVRWHVVPRNETDEFVYDRLAD